MAKKKATKKTAAKKASAQYATKKDLMQMEFNIVKVLFWAAVIWGVAVFVLKFHGDLP